MPKIRSILAREILDSRGLPTVEAEVVLEGGLRGRAAVPSGASTGTHEALELRDQDAGRYGGKGVLKAVAHVNGELAKALAGRDAADPAQLDEAMLALDGTPNKSRLGANALLAVSLAAARACAAAANEPLHLWLRRAYGLPTRGKRVLPTPLLNVVNGGKHADSGLDIQEFMLVPTGAAAFSEGLRMGAEIYQALKKLLAAQGLSTAVGDEGGFAPRIASHEDVLKVLMQAIEKAGHAGKVELALDSAATEFYAEGRYKFEGQALDSAQMAAVYSGWLGRYPLRSLEDPLAEDDWQGWKAATAALGERVRLVGDDLFVTDPKRLERGIREASANAILIKLNQIGTLTETVRTVLAAQKAGFTAIISHRSGETEDPFIADLAVALDAGAIKTGAPCRSERTAKYNQLLRIEAELGGDCEYAGARPFAAAAASRRG